MDKLDQHNSKREEIIQAALQLFMEKGYENTAISHIIQAANVSKGGMYHHFKSKEEILDVVIHYLIDIDMERINAVLTNKKMGAIEKFNQLSILNEKKPEKLTDITEHLLRSSNSLFDYRARELSIARTIPIIVEVIQQGVEEGVFQTEYPKEMGEMYFNLLTSLFESSAPIEIKDLIKKVDAFLHVISLSLNIDVAELQPMRESMIGQISKIGDE